MGGKPSREAIQLVATSYTQKTNLSSLTPSNVIDILDKIKNEHNQISKADFASKASIELFNSDERGVFLNAFDNIDWFKQVNSELIDAQEILLCLFPWLKVEKGNKTADFQAIFNEDAYPFEKFMNRLNGMYLMVLVHTVESAVDIKTLTEIEKKEVKNLSGYYTKDKVLNFTKKNLWNEMTITHGFIRGEKDVKELLNNNEWMLEYKSIHDHYYDSFGTNPCCIGH